MDACKAIVDSRRPPKKQRQRPVVEEDESDDEPEYQSPAEEDEELKDENEELKDDNQDEEDTEEAEEEGVVVKITKHRKPKGGVEVFCHYANKDERPEWQLLCHIWADFPEVVEAYVSAKKLKPEQDDGVWSTPMPSGRKEIVTIISFAQGGGYRVHKECRYDVVWQNGYTEKVPYQLLQEKVPDLLQKFLSYYKNQTTTLEFSHIGSPKGSFLPYWLSERQFLPYWPRVLFDPYWSQQHRRPNMVDFRICHYDHIGFNHIGIDHIGTDHIGTDHIGDLEYQPYWPPQNGPYWHHPYWRVITEFQPYWFKPILATILVQYGPEDHIGMTYRPYWAQYGRTARKNLLPDPVEFYVNNHIGNHPYWKP